MPSPEAEPTPGRRWNPWEIAPIHGVDTAGIGLLRVRVWRFRRPEIPASGARQARLPGGCLAPLRCVSQPTQRLTLRLARGRCAPLQNPRLVGSLPEQRAGRFRRPANPVNGPPVAERTALVAARVTPAEHATWHEKAAAAGRLYVRAAARGDGADANVDRACTLRRARAHPRDRANRQQPEPACALGEHAHSRADLLLSLNLRIRPTPFPPIDSRRLGIRPELSGGPRAPASAVPRRLSDSTGGRSWPSSSRRVRTAP